MEYFASAKKRKLSPITLRFYVPNFKKLLPNSDIIVSTENDISTIEIVFNGTESEFYEFKHTVYNHVMTIVTHAETNTDKIFRFGCVGGNAIAKLKHGLTILQDTTSHCGRCGMNSHYDEEKREFRIAANGLAYSIAVDEDDSWITVTDLIHQTDPSFSTLRRLHWIFHATIIQPFIDANRN